MNIFTKLTVGIIFLGITQHVFSQEMMYKTHQKADTPFYNGNAVRNSFLKQQTAFDTLWLPVSIHKTASNGNLARSIYEYDENGLLKKITTYFLPSGEVACLEYYNNTYIDPLVDVTDTIYFERHENTIPKCRYYYNNRQADSSYWEEYYQLWDGEKWNTEWKYYVHLLDTATVSEFQDHIEEFDRNGNITRGQKASLTFDNQGNVSEAMVELYDTITKQYKISHKYVYWYDNNGKCITRRDYYYTSSGTWKLWKGFTDIKWFEFYGFNNGDLLFFGRPQGLYSNYSPKNKNKMSSLRFWGFSGGSQLMSVDTMKWTLEPFSSHYFSYKDNMCLWEHAYYEYNEHHHITDYGNLYYYFWDCDTISFDYIINDYTNKYDARGRHYEYTWYQEALGVEDTLFYAGETKTVDSFTYIVRQVGIDELSLAQPPLSIVPNPSDETVRITAEDFIATITLYTSDGRLAHTQEGGEKEIILNLQGLAKGIYVVQARLKNGKVQTGKMVVR